MLWDVIWPKWGLGLFWNMDKVLEDGGGEVSLKPGMTQRTGESSLGKLDLFFLYVKCPPSLGSKHSPYKPGTIRLTLFLSDDLLTCSALFWKSKLCLFKDVFVKLLPLAVMVGGLGRPRNTFFAQNFGINILSIHSCTMQTGADPASQCRGATTAIFGSEVSIGVHYCKRDEVGSRSYASQHYCDKTMDGKMALYRKCCFP